MQPRHRNDSKLTARRPPGHGPRPPRLGTRDRQPLLKIRPAQSPGVISRTATAARPHLGSGRDLQSRKEFKFGSGGGDGRTAETRVTASRQSRQSRPTHTRRAAGNVCQPGRQCYKAPGPARPGPPGTPGSRTQRHCNVAATKGQKPGQRATTFRNNSSALGAAANNCFTPQKLVVSTAAPATFAKSRSNFQNAHA